MLAAEKAFQYLLASLQFSSLFVGIVPTIIASAIIAVTAVAVLRLLMSILP